MLERDKRAQQVVDDRDHEFAHHCPAPFGGIVGMRGGVFASFARLKFGLSCGASKPASNATNGIATRNGTAYCGGSIGAICSAAATAPTRAVPILNGVIFMASPWGMVEG
jgi:hypothetical protein